MRVIACSVLLITAWVAGLGQPKRASLGYVGKGESRNKVFIEYDHQSRYYDLISDFKLSRAELNRYKDGIRLIKGKNTAALPKRDIAGLPLKWCLLRTYQSECFLYYPSRPENNYRIAFNDTTSIEFADGKVTPSQLLAVKKTKENSYSIMRMGADKKTNTIIVHIIDANYGVALVENLFPDTKYTLMVQAEKIRKFDIIINDSKNHKAPEYPFAKPDLRNLVQRIERQN